MPKIVCLKCETELIAEHNGTIVVEMASFGAYRVWIADTLKCPGCGNRVVANFGAKPVLQAGNAGFDEEYHRLVDKAERVVYDYGRPH